jgi:superfamily II DNA or RNA helicase
MPQQGSFEPRQFLFPLEFMLDPDDPRSEDMLAVIEQHDQPHFDIDDEPEEVPHIEVSEDDYKQLTIDDIERKSRRMPTPTEYAISVHSYLRSPEAKSVLRAQQVTVFEDVQQFFTNGKHRGYIDLPTGTGKTVLFVELCKAFLQHNEQAPRPRILVVTPTKDLVHQTMGRSGEKGFGRFASDLKVGSYFSDTTEKEKREREDYDITVTTYQSFRLMARQQFHALTKKEQEELADQDVENQAPTVQKRGVDRLREIIETAQAESANRRGKVVDAGYLYSRPIDDYDLIIFDEAHHTLHDSNRHVIREISEDVAMIGFSATPDINETQKLETILPHKIHELKISEAIALDMLAPVVPIGIDSGIAIRGSNIFDSTGEFIDHRISYLAYDATRNQRIIEAAKVLAEADVPTIISCIAGDDAWHPKYLAEALTAQGVPASCVWGAMAARERQKIYKQYNEGEIKVLTFIGVLGEGWDSPITKGLINARPTRSQVFARQRPGRVTRLGGTAFAIDICDDVEGRDVPMTISDALEFGTVPLGTIIGEANDDAKVITVVSKLRDRLPLLAELRSTFKEGEVHKKSLPKVGSGGHGRVMVGASEAALFSLPTTISSAYTGVTEQIVQRYEQLTGRMIERREAVQGNIVRTVYHRETAATMIYSLPIAPEDRYYIDDKKEKWIGPAGLAKLFSKRFPQIDEAVITDALYDIEDELDWIPGKVLTTPPKAYHRRFKVVKLYSTKSETITAINAALKEHFEGEIDS